MDLSSARRWSHSVLAPIWADKQTIHIVLFTIAVQILGILAGLLFFPHGQSYLGGTIFHRLLTWDGLDYLAIGQSGYVWHGTYCLKHFCNLAFFPLQGMIDKIFLTLFGHDVAVIIIVLTSWALGIASIFCFARLARGIMGQGAGSAIFLYALYPGSVFFPMGYPAGIISITLILALHNALQNRWWWAALCVGIGGAAGSAVIFVGFAIGVYYLFDQLKRRQIFIALSSSLGWALLALSGLLLFMVYQYVAFGDATAFIAAQMPWTGDATPAYKIQRLTTFYWYVAYYLEMADWYRNAFHTLLMQHGDVVIFFNGLKYTISDFIELLTQSVLNLMFFVIAWVGLILCGFFCIGKKARILLCGSSLVVLLGYMWFILATEWDMESTIRLLFPALALFIGLGGLTHKFKLLGYGLFPFFTVVTFLQMALTISGYQVI